MALYENVNLGKVTADAVTLRVPPGQSATSTTQPPRMMQEIVGPIVAMRTTDGTTNHVLVPAGFVVTSVVHQVITVSGASAMSIDIGDANDPDGWVENTNGVAGGLGAGGKVTGAGDYADAALIAASSGKLYSTATMLISTDDVTTPAGAAGSHRIFVYGYQS